MSVFSNWSLSLGFADQNLVRTSPLLHTNSATGGTLSCYDLLRAVRKLDLEQWQSTDMFLTGSLRFVRKLCLEISDIHPPCKGQVFFIPDQ